MKEERPISGCKISVDDVIALQLHILEEQSSYVWSVFSLTVNKYNLYCLHFLAHYLKFVFRYESLGITNPLIYVHVCAVSLLL